MSKTERDLAADGAADALDELFDDDDFDEALDAALEEADVNVPTEDADTQVADADDTDVADQADGSDASAELDTSELDTAELDTVDDGGDGDADESADAALDTDDEADVAETESDDADPTASETDASDDADLDADARADDDADAGGDEDEYEFPQIVPATPDDEESTEPSPDAFVEEELDADEVAEEILEELRRADIDGPQVEMAPQDDTTAARRRPRRAVDYDPAPMPIPARVPRVLARKPRVRKVTRVVRHVDPWSVFKIALVAHLVLYIIVLTAGVLLWNVAHATGTVDNVERFFESFGWQSFEFNGGEIYHAAWIAGLFAVIGLTGMAVLLATLFNLITDLVGGVRFTVLEEEVVETRTSPLRRFVVRRPEPDVPARLSDHSGPMYREAVVDDTSANERPSR